MRSARAALGFLTVVGGAHAPVPAALGWFPLVGAGLGGLLGLIWIGADRLWPPLLAAVVVVAADLAITGMIHFDGLVDSADGLLPHMDRDRRLAVMRAPDTGAFGVGAGATLLLARVTALSALVPNPLLLVALWCASRSLMAVAANTVPYARDNGLALAFLGGRTFPLAAVGLGTAIAIAWLGHGISGSLSVVLGLFAGGVVVALAYRRLGGFTGDVLGAACVISETVGLVTAAARW